MRKLWNLLRPQPEPVDHGFVARAEVLRRLGKLDEAEQVVRKGLEAVSEFAPGYVVAGRISLDKGEAEAAEAAFSRALSLDPRNVETLRSLGRILIEKGDLEHALELLRRLAQEEPWNRGLMDQICEVEAQEDISGQQPDTDQTRESEAQEDLAGLNADRDDLGWPSQWLGGSEPRGDPWDSATLQADVSDPTEARVEDDSLSWEEIPAPPEEVAEQEAGRMVGQTAVDHEGGEAGRPPGRSPSDQEPPASDPQHHDDALLTRTLGEIYLRQGLLDKARAVFRELLTRNSDDEELRERLAEVEARFPEGSPRPVIPIQDLSPSGTVPIGSLAPHAFPDRDPAVPPLVVSIAALAPEDHPPTEESSPIRVVPVESLAPVAWSERAPVEAEDAVLIDELAPSVVVPVADLAPDDLGVEFSLPQEDNAEIEAEKKRILDEFENWLDTLP
jgi:tetratricopeptide (TPR) repeat protein